jgi:tetraprenyl-beta-curcumene synthase
MTPPTRFDPVTDPRRRGADRVVLAAGFAGAARRYWLTVFPRVRHELSRWRERAGEIPDPVLQALAFDAQRKRGNIEGAAAFATFAPRANRAALVRAMVAYQAAYDYLDVLAEQPRADPVAGSRELHRALLVALDPTAPLDRGGGQPDYYARYPRREDNGYLAELVDGCRTALGTLPSYTSVAAAARRAAERIVEFQSLNLSEAQGEHDAFALWARTETPPGTELRWWETAGAGGSPIGLYALIAAAADPVVDPGDLEAIENAYFPWIGALHSLLDHLVDRSQDAASGQRNLIDCYASPREAAVRMQALAVRAAGAARALPRGRRHAIILAGMMGHYLADPEASAPDAGAIAGDLRTAMGGLATPTLAVFRARRLAGRLAAHRRSGLPTSRSKPVRAGVWKNGRGGLRPLSRARADPPHSARVRGG